MREDENGEARVERTRPGLALQPSPSLLRAEGAALSTVPEVSRNQSNAETIADSFVKFLTGGGLGTGLALRSDSSLLRRRTAPGACACLRVVSTRPDSQSWRCVPRLADGSGQAAARAQLPT